MNNLVSLINNSGYDIYFLVVDKNLDIDLPQLKYFYKIYLPEKETKNSSHLLSLQKTQDFIKSTSLKNKHLPAIFPFKPSAKIDKICKDNAWINLSNPAHLNRFLEDKVNFYQFCKKFKLPTIKSNIAEFNKKNFEKYSNNKSLVIQTRFGWAGNSTYFAPNYDSVKNKIAQNSIVKYTPFIKNSQTIINNCCLTRFGIIQSPPALQLTGLKEYSNNMFSTVGRQWPANISLDTQNKIKRITNNFGSAIATMCYRGYFGLDMMLVDDKIYILECNPRLTASFAFYHSLEETMQTVSLIYLHIAELLDLNYSIDIKTQQKRFYLPIKGKEITPRDSNNQIITKIHEN